MRRLKVYTAYEYLGHRFDPKTRLLGAGLFLLQRGLASGITIYAPAIILSTVLGWRQDATIVLTGSFVIIYTVAGGNDAVSITQKWQMAVIFAGLVAAFVVVLAKIPAGLGLGGALSVAGGPSCDATFAGAGHSSARRSVTNSLTIVSTSLPTAAARRSRVVSISAGKLMLTFITLQSPDFHILPRIHPQVIRIFAVRFGANDTLPSPAAARRA